MWPLHWNNDKIIKHGLAEILENQRRIMAEIDNLNQNVAKLSADVASLLSKQAGSVPAAQVQAAADAVAQIDATVVAATPA